MQSKEGIATCAFIALRPTKVQFPRGRRGGGRGREDQENPEYSLLKNVTKKLSDILFQINAWNRVVIMKHVQTRKV